MTRDIDLGFVALTDAAPLLVAQAHGLFASERLEVRLHREASWATIRDKVAAGVFHGAHMLAPMVLAARLGVGAGVTAAPLIAPIGLGANSAAIGVSATLAEAMDAARAEDGGAALAGVVAARKTQALAPLTFAVVFPFSMHNYMLRFWAAAAGVDPDRDLRIVVSPPTAIAARLASGEIDGFAVGAPWGGYCAQVCGAHLVLQSGGFWPGGPEKTLALSEAWAEAAPEAALALTRAVLRAALWADAPQNAQALTQLLAARIGAPAEVISRHLGGGENSVRFASAALPHRSHAAWQLSQMLRWGQLRPNAALAYALDGYRADFFHAAAQALDAEAPPNAPDAPLLDGPRFNPDDMAGYVAGFAISRLGS